MSSNLYFKIFTNCIVVKGVNRSIVVDLQRQSFTTIPDTMHEVIELFNAKKSINEIYNLYEENEKEVIDEYLDFLLENEFGFYTDSDEFDRFIDMDKKFELASPISNSIIEVSNLTLSNLDNIIVSLGKLYCVNLQFVCYNEIELDNLKKILEASRNSDFRSIELVLKYSNVVFDFISQIDKYNFRITELTFHSSSGKDKEVIDHTFAINFLDYEIKNFANCGVVDNKYFGINKDKVLESLNHNSCLHKKLSIDKDGNIKNCPSMPQSFGNIKDTTLEEALNHPDFKKYWNVNKDMIAVCKDCEFRHICTDCRAYTERTHFEEDIDLSKPLKCGYNPYTNEWAEWSTNPLKQKAIEFYGMQDLVKKDA
ncbi:grasp-with-spasm system SPASM domain peptide maturase [Flavobacterium sp.]|uniref:grasp-with-spasm system SPASM domain peptide maturase n=1 Tax=Flavobacterium sp. TaxID=239 RepID=UPI003753382D